MKPPVFDYYDPATEEETLALLAQFGDDAKILAGGQSLMPLLNMRLVAPGRVIDVNRVESLASMRTTPEALHIGALTRQRQVERADDVARYCPLLAEALQHVGYPQIRHRGTIGGSLVHADPAAELGAVMTAVEAQLELHSQQGSRVLTPETFFVSYLTTALEPDELLYEIRVPHQPPRTGWSFMEVARVAGAFALVGAAALVTLDDADRCVRARLALTGVGSVPHRAVATEAALQGEQLAPQHIQEAAQRADDNLDPDSDVHASAAYRRNLARVLAQRTLTAAWQRALAPATS
jgi:CO/xanthine dehydrogenase FAD-binding subunit